tara:strand:- start:189 stop:1025 length:837 start_codon:yes stop_codon:yes gene_type:complete
MFRLKSYNPKKLIHIFSSIEPILDTVTLHIDKECISIRDIDTSHLCLIDMELNKDDFEEYEFTFEKPKQMSFYTKHIVNVLKVASKATSVKLKYTDGDTIKIVIDNKYSRKTYNIPLINVLDKDPIHIPDRDYPFELELTHDILKDIIDSAEITESDTIAFKIKDKKLFITAKGALGKFEQVFEKQKFKNKTISLQNSKRFINKTTSRAQYELYSCEGEFENTFSLDYINRFTKANNLSNKIMINMAPDYPLRMDFCINNETGSILYYYLPPKLGQSH